MYGIGPKRDAERSVVFLVHGRLKSLRVEVYDSHLLLTSFTASCILLRTYSWRSPMTMNNERVTVTRYRTL